MITKDSITMVLFQLIDVTELMAAKQNGNLFSYFNTIAEKIVRPDVECRETVSDPSMVRPPTPHPMRIERTGDSIRVSRL